MTIKSLLVAFFLTVFGFSSAMAAARNIPAKVTAIQGEEVTIVAEADLPNWAQEGRYLRVNDSAGKNILRGAEVTAQDGRTVTITTKSADKLKVDKALVLNRGRKEAGC